MRDACSLICWPSPLLAIPSCIMILPGWGILKMAGADWTTRRVSVASLHLDKKNPRLGRETLAKAPREIIQYLFEHDKALEVAESIATRGFFPNEPLLAINEDNRLVVVEGNRRLAALKALKEPGLLEGGKQRQVERLSRKILDQQSLATVPVTIAPNRKATDRQIAGRHIGTPVLAWQAENRASFILEKLFAAKTLLARSILLTLRTLQKEKHFT